MTRIADLLNEQKNLEAHLLASDIHTIETALAELMADNPSLTLADAVTELAESEDADPNRLWRGLEDYWTEGSEVPLEESVTRRMKAASRRVRRGVRRAKNRYDRAKNSRRGRAVRRVAKGIGRAARTNTGRAVAGIALGAIGL